MKEKKKNKKKWSKKHGDATFGFWNPWSYCNKRHEYVKSLKIDVLGLGELHNKHLEEHYKEKRWICSERSKLTKQGEDPDPSTWSFAASTSTHSRPVHGPPSCHVCSYAPTVPI